jgi:hypothetical protein
MSFWMFIKAVIRISPSIYLKASFKFPFPLGSGDGRELVEVTVLIQCRSTSAHRQNLICKERAITLVNKIQKKCKENILLV